MMNLGILVHGDNHFIVKGPMPDCETALALAHFWSVITIDRETPPALVRWTISTSQYREDLQWAVMVDAESEVSPAVKTLLSEMAARGILLRHARMNCW